ncbi:hypothetical protein BGX28_004580 [Mortierella sp. GBA30]|nr:hypothetical protein BGX28_004580 [Mortierella sp. GBA30]
MDDHSMDEDFDFKSLSLEEPEERLQSMFEGSFNINAPDTTPSSVIPSNQPLQESIDNPSTDTPDNGPWARLPSSAEMNPYLPGVTAQKLDAMAMDPKHVFKSAQAPFPFPFTSPPSPSSAAFRPASGSNNTESGPISEENKEQEDTDKEKIPAWMLKDPEMTPVPTWNQSDASAPEFSSKDFGLDWSSSGTNMSTAIDSNALFGFSSFPTYESLPISNVIADEHQRRMYESESSALNDPSSSSILQRVKEGGFAKYGNHNQGDSPPMFRSGEAGLSAGTTTEGKNIGMQWDDYQGSSIPSTVARTLSDRPGSHEWQKWRSTAAPQRDQDVGMDRDYDEEFYALDYDSRNEIKATPGFAPAQFHCDDK